MFLLVLSNMLTALLITTLPCVLIEDAIHKYCMHMMRKGIIGIKILTVSCFSALSFAGVIHVRLHVKACFCNREITLGKNFKLGEGLRQRWLSKSLQPCRHCFATCFTGTTESTVAWSTASTLP